MVKHKKSTETEVAACWRCASLSTSRLPSSRRDASCSRLSGRARLSDTRTSSDPSPTACARRGGGSVDLDRSSAVSRLLLGAPAARPSLRRGRSPCPPRPSAAARPRACIQGPDPSWPGRAVSATRDEWTQRAQWPRPRGNSLGRIGHTGSPAHDNNRLAGGPSTKSKSHARSNAGGGSTDDHRQRNQRAVRSCAAASGHVEGIHHARPIHRVCYSSWMFRSAPPGMRGRASGGARRARGSHPRRADQARASPRGCPPTPGPLR